MMQTSAEPAVALPEFAPVHYEDTFTAPIRRHGAVSPDDLAHASRLAMPKWALGLLGLRNILVGWMGLKTGREGRAKGYGVFDIFKTFSQTENETVLGAEDRHLDFRVLVRLARIESGQTLSMTTQVHFHNRAGRVYFFFVKPFHRLIVRTHVRHMAKRLSAD